MKILLFTALLLLIIFLIKYFVSSKWRIGINLLVGFGIFIGVLVLGLNALFDETFGASTPVNVGTQNLTNENLKVYAIAFWDNSWNKTGNYVTFDSEIKPKEESDFWFENDGTSEFWIVAKNENNGIEYLQVIKENESEYDVEITADKKNDPDKVQIAQELTTKADKKQQMKRYAVWANIFLIGLLIFSLFKMKTGGNTAKNKDA